MTRIRKRSEMGRWQPSQTAGCGQSEPAAHRTRAGPSAPSGPVQERHPSPEEPQPPRQRPGSHRQHVPVRKLGHGEADGLQPWLGTALSPTAEIQREGALRGVAGWDPTSEVRPGYLLADTRPAPTMLIVPSAPRPVVWMDPGIVFFPSRSSLSLADLAPLWDSKVTTWFSIIPNTRFPPQPHPW